MVGCCDTSEEHAEVARTADDYLWLKLSTIKSRPAGESTDFSYSDLQKMILEEYGEDDLLCSSVYVAHEFPRLDIVLLR